jgi:hypothetical protein
MMDDAAAQCKDGAYALSFRRDSAGLGTLSWGPVQIGVSNSWEGYGFNDSESKVERMSAAAYARVRDMLAGNPDAGTAVYRRMDGYSGVTVQSGMFTLTGDCGLATVFGHSVDICLPYSGANKDGIDAFLRFLLEAENGESDESE